jgi:hypothetical protein
MPHALAPALPSGNKRIGIDGVIFVLVAFVVFLVDEQMYSPIAVSSSSSERKRLQFRIELLSESRENGAS